MGKYGFSFSILILIRYLQIGVSDWLVFFLKFEKIFFEILDNLKVKSELFVHIEWDPKYKYQRGGV